MGVSAAIGGSALIGGMSAKKAAGKTAEATKSSTEASIAEQRRQFDLLQQQQEPYRLAGLAGLQQYANQLGVAIPNVAQAPALQAQLSDIDTQIADLQQRAEFSTLENTPSYRRLQLEKSFGSRDHQRQRQLMAEAQKEMQTMTPATDFNNQLTQLQQQRQTIQDQLYQPANQATFQEPMRPGAAQVNAPAGQAQPEEVLPTFTAPGGAELPQFQFNLEEDPGYRFAVDQAMEATTRTAARQGQRMSGNLLAEVSGIGAGMASQYANQAFQRQMAGYGANYQRAQDIYGRGLGEYGLKYQRAGDIYGRTQNYLNRLAGLAGVGQTAAAQTGVAGMQMAGNIGQTLAQGAAGQAGAAQLQYGGMNQAIQGGLGNYLAYQQNQQLLNTLAPPPPPATNQYSTYGPYATGYKWGP